MSYLRFTPEEFQAIRQACRPRDLGEGSFPAFRPFLVKSLAGPGRAVGGPPRPPARPTLRVPPRATARPGGGRGLRRDESAGGLTFREWQAVRQASDPFFLTDGSLRSFQDSLVGTLRGTAPGLADKLARLSRPQIARLYYEVRKRRRGGA